VDIHATEQAYGKNKVFTAKYRLFVYLNIFLNYRTIIVPMKNDDNDFSWQFATVFLSNIYTT
jgi:hypothetical protein